jgi:hypothetical protein
MGLGGLPVSARYDADTHHLETEQGLLVEGLLVHDDLASAARSRGRHHSCCWVCRIWDRCLRISGIAVGGRIELPGGDCCLDC